MSSDSVGDMFTKIRNAALRGHRTVAVPSTKLTRGITQVLWSENYIAGFEENVSVGVKNYLLIALKYKYVNGEKKKRKPVFTKLARLSKPGNRKYIQSSRIHSSVAVKIGTILISTTKGIMSGGTARKERLGGELLGYIY